jgi:protoheme IX farnesyltransferase
MPAHTDPLDRHTTDADRRTTDADRRITAALFALVLGVYALMLAGTTTAVTGAAAACPTWPACAGLTLGEGIAVPVLVVLFHRILALVVGLSLLWLVWHVRGDIVARGVRRPIVAAAVLYPIQVAVGAVAVGADTPLSVSGAHLVVAVAIFAALTLALARQLTDVSDVDVPTRQDSANSGSGDVTQPSRIESDRSRGSRASSEATWTGVRSLFPGQSWEYLRMTKPRLMWLLCLVALAAMLLAGGRTVPAERIAWTLLGGVLAVGASGVFNNVLERDVDEQMARTADRPLVDRRVSVRRATIFGVVLTLASTGVFVARVNLLAALLGVLAILSYSVGYTVLLKPNTTQNIVIGGAVGTFPALIGWSAVTGSIGFETVVLGVVIFLWTPAHFYNLALMYKEEYATAGFPMLPVVRGEETTRQHIMLYLAATMVAVALLGALTALDWAFAVTAVVAGGAFLWFVVRLCRRRTDRAARDAFVSANAYLGVLLVAIALDSVLV